MLAQACCDRARNDAEDKLKLARKALGDTNAQSIMPQKAEAEPQLRTTENERDAVLEKHVSCRGKRKELEALKMKREKTVAQVVDSGIESPDPVR